MAWSLIVRISKVIWDIFSRILLVATDMAIWVGTLPYYRFYRHNTIEPLKKISTLACQPLNSRKVLKEISRWRARKLTELQFISIACAIVAAAVIGAFSWNTVVDAYWLAHALWHGSLVLSILGILLAAQQIAILYALGPLPRVTKPDQADAAIQRYSPLLLSKASKQIFQVESQSKKSVQPRKKMVFIWQCPMMLMSYSVTAFLAGLTILVCTPLIRRDEWNSGCNIAVMYLTISAISSAAFLFCSFWIFHYVDLEFATSDEEDEEEDCPDPDFIASRMILEAPVDHASIQTS
ncbi:uncharacterized protein BDR25DRAFT_285382 [Lindgomyces ingoldianus]|uniref:Uncharacterized protein n=1 Tax=Lindgomyces ingoldianus TaxID=673940 RepID=A0ACB6QXR5_9PLEO|nr:uncharacterized protein BDR25DRAFT_285382 [Lindgomyces ingoldianus]KAF2471779.1 hypothetical protein BDR25DRAFT_285382 [Lindgomyces ingoldianus]